MAETARTSAVDSSARLPHQPGPAGVDATIAALEDRLAERELEVLRLRDLLIGAEAELGTLAGTVLALRRELESVGDLPDRYNAVIGSTTWKAMWVVMTPYRKVRERVGAAR